MAKLPVEKMRELERRFGEIEARMSAGPSADVYVKLASEYSELQPVVTKIRAYEKAIAELADLEILLNDKSVDREMRDLAELELPDVKE
ncbi:PCRF domain-containing protein, partial [Rhizobium cauense]|uniref:PCRF domain-containing protein n=1 Tax=Rhizobium cauense TaxID=1166683 RepID=UPI001C6F26F8|nr:PCRF domain-containing protein [Rhizobium cauense]